MSLLLACALHYYAALAVLAFFAAEFLFVWTSRRIRYGVWLALIASPIPIAIGWPLLARLEQVYAQNFIYESPGLNSLSKAYGGYFRMESPWANAFVAIAVLAMFGALLRNSAQPNEPKGARAARTSERALVLALILIPVVGYLLAKSGHVPFVDRYVLPAILGIVAALGYFLSRVNLKNQLICGVLVLFAVGSQEVGVWSSHLRIFNTPVAQTNLVAHLKGSAQHGDLPIVISDMGAYVEFWNYAPSALRANVFGLDDAANAVVYSGTDTLDKVVIPLRSYTPIAVEDFAKFTRVHSSFLLLSNGSKFDWWPARLAHDGDRLELLVVQGQYKVYLVELTHTLLPANPFLKGF